MKNENPVILDRWESQLVWYAKGWSKEKISMEDALKHLWGNRCGLKTEHVNISYLVRPLLKLLIKLNVFDNLDNALSTFIEDTGPQQKYSNGILYTDNQGYYSRICWVCLYEFLSIIQVYDGPEQTDPRFIMLPFEPNLFIKAEYDN